MEISKQWKKTVAEKDDYKYKYRDLRRENGELRHDAEAFHLVQSAIGVKETDDILRRAEQERQHAESNRKAKRNLAMSARTDERKVPMIKKIEMPDVCGVIIREPINIDEPIILDGHIPHSRPYTNDRRIPYPTALNFTKRIGTVDYEANTHFAEESKSTLLSQFRDLILAQKLTEDLMR